MASGGEAQALQPASSSTAIRRLMFTGLPEPRTGRLSANQDLLVVHARKAAGAAARREVPRVEDVLAKNGVQLRVVQRQHWHVASDDALHTGKKVGSLLLVARDQLRLGEPVELRVDPALG
jgi:hypothetical protein